MIICTKESIRNGTASLGEIKALFSQNDSRAYALGVSLRWKYTKGIYYGFIRYGDKIIFQKIYNDRLLIDALINMHFDFTEFMNKSKATWNI